MTVRKWWIGLIALIALHWGVVALFASGTIPQEYRRDDRVFWMHQGGDNYDYHALARALSQGEVIPSRYPLGYPLMLMPFIWLSGGAGHDALVEPVSAWWALVMFPFMQVLLAWQTYQLTRDRTIALLSVLIYTLMPLLFWAVVWVMWNPTMAEFISVHMIGAQMLSDIPATFMTLLAFALYWRLRQEWAMKWAIGLGVVLGWLVMIRYSAALTPLTFAFLLALEKRWRALIIVSLVALLVFIPQVIYNMVYFDHPLKTGYEVLDELPPEGLFSMSYFWDALGVMWERLGILLLVGVLVAGGMLAWLLRWIWRKEPIGAWWLALWIGGYIALYVPYYYSWTGAMGRFMIPIYPAIALLGAVTVFACLSFLRRLGLRRVAPMVALCAFVGLPLTSQAQVQAPWEQRHFEQTEQDGVQEYSGTFSEDDYILVYLKYLKQGDTVYAYAESDSADGVLVLVDVGFETYLAQDDYSGGGDNPALTYTFQEGGTYVLALLSRVGSGDYRMVVGINTPSISATESFYDGLSNNVPFTCGDEPLVPRPLLSGTPQRFERPLFVVHYTLTGDDATTLEYVTELALALELSLTIQTGLLGWAMPPPDCGEGGDDRLDIYVKDLGDYTLGYATADRFVGDNPNTSVREIRAAYGHLIIDNDMAIDGNIPPEALALVRVTAAHEIHHLIQFGYDSNETFFGFYEAGAVWLETVIYPEVSSAAEHASTYLQTTDYCLGSMAEGVPVNRIYGEWLLVDSLAQDYGLDVYQRIWQALAISDGMLAFYNGLEALGTTPEAAMRRMAIRNLLRDYALGSGFFPVRLEGELSTMGDLMPAQRGIEELGAAYVRLSLPGGVYSLDINPPLLRMTLIGIRDGIAYDYMLGASNVVDTSPYEEVYLIIHNPQRHIDFEACTSTRWRLRVGDGRGSATVSANEATWDTGRYVRP